MCFFVLSLIDDSSTLVVNKCTAKAIRSDKCSITRCALSLYISPCHVRCTNNHPFLKLRSFSQSHLSGRMSMLMCTLLCCDKPAHCYCLFSISEFDSITVECVSTPFFWKRPNQTQQSVTAWHCQTPSAVMWIALELVDPGARLEARGYLSYLWRERWFRKSTWSGEWD